MFNTSFTFEFKNYQKQGDSIEYNYFFRGKSNERYFVKIEKLEMGLCFVKFCLAKHKRLPNRYSIHSKLFELPRVVKTIFLIFSDFTKRFSPNSSFAIYGINSEDEGKSSTKRFNLYSRIVKTFISNIQYDHYYTEKYSTILVLHKSSGITDIDDYVLDVYNKLNLVYDLDREFADTVC